MPKITDGDKELIFNIKNPFTQLRINGFYTFKIFKSNYF